MKLLSLNQYSAKIISLIFLFISSVCGLYYFYFSAKPIEYFFTRARTFHAEGNPTDAKKEYLALLEKNPTCIAAHFNLAQLYAGDLEWEQACFHYKKALEYNPPESQKYLFHFCYGTALFRLDKLTQAREQLDQSLALQPTTKAYMQRSLILQKIGEPDAARMDLDYALKEDPSYIDGYIELGNHYRDQYQFNKAIECYRKHIAHKPDFYGAYLMLADALHLQAKHSNNDTFIPDAMAAYEKTIGLNPLCYQAQLNLGLMHLEQDNDKKAMELFNAAYKNNPEFKFINIAKGICHIKRGEIPQGWDGYEWRTVISETRFDHLPKWDGKQLLKDKTIILHTEQGYGDTLHFVRYAKIAKQMGATVIVETQARLKKLISLCPYIDKIIIPSDAIPACDYQLPLLSMPTVLRTSLKTIPSEIPYLYIDESLVNYWKKELAHDKNFKVGICWQVNKDHDFTKYSNNSVEIQIFNSRRTIELAQLKPLTELEGVSFYSLQFGANEQECHALNIHTFSDLDTKNGPFMDTAAIMKNLDLMITVDTSLAHLAGGLGVKTWIMLPFAAEWRWMKNRSDTPWYPTVRLFRCSKKGEWQPIITEIQNVLASLVNMPH